MLPALLNIRKKINNMQYESTFNAIDNILRNEAGCGNELDYIEQTSWLLFLKYLDDLETDREDEAELEGKSYKRIITGFYRWSQWAAPKDRDANIDPFHVNRKVMSCFGPDAREISNNILGMVIDGYAAEAADCVEMAGAMGLANRCWPEVADYLRNNAECIYRPGAASLGTMEAEQQHVYGARMDSVPCGWSVRGADAMARVRSRRASQRELPRLTREMSVTPRRKKRAERLAAEAERRSARAIPTASRVPLSVGRGRGAEHTASLVGAPANVRYAAGVDSGMVAIGW